MRQIVKNFKNLSVADQRILWGGILILTMASYIISNENLIHQFLLGSNQRALTPVGSIISKKNYVKRRKASDFTWTVATENMKIFQMDSIFTGPDSEAIIRIDTGEEILIKPRSLVVIDAQKDSISVNISFGSIKGSLKSGKKLVISSRETVTEISGDNATVNLSANDGSNLLIDVIKGRVDVVSDNQLITLNENEKNNISQKHLESETKVKPAAEKRKIDIVFPQNLSEIHLQKGFQIDFRWAPLPNISSPYYIYISRNSSFTDLVLVKKLNEEFFSTSQLPKNTQLFWKVVTLGKQAYGQYESNPMILTVIGQQIPIPYYPSYQSVTYFEKYKNNRNTGISTTLKWNSKSNGKSWEVQLALDSQFTVGLKSFRTKSKYYTTELLKGGTYYWRVRSKRFADQPWGKHSRFIFVQRSTNEIHSKDVIISPITHILQTRANLNIDTIPKIRSSQSISPFLKKDLKISWINPKKSAKYILEISKNKIFSKPVLKREVSSNNYTWRNPLLGHFYWRLSPASTLQDKGTFPPPQYLNIVLAPPTPNTIQPLEEYLSTEAAIIAPPPPLLLTWSPTVYTSSYEIQLSSDKNFKAPIIFKSQNAQQTIQLPSPGTFFWRVRSLNNQSTPITLFSRLETIIYTRIVDKSLPPIDTLSLFPVPGDTIVFVGNGKNEIYFQWERINNHRKYKIQIANSPTFENPLVSKIVNSTVFKLSQTLRSGWLFWRFRYENEEKTSPWIGSFQFKISYERDAFDFEQSDRYYLAKMEARSRQYRMIALNNLGQNQGQRMLASLDRAPLTAPIIRDQPTDFILESKFHKDVTWLELSRQPQKDFYEQTRNHPSFQWESINTAEGYLIEISKYSNFSKILVAAKSLEHEFLWKTVRPGTFHWRVSTLEDKRYKSLPTQGKVFSVKMAAPTLLPPESTKIPQGLKSPNQKLLSWSPVAFARVYKIQISTEESFRKYRSYISQKTSYVFAGSQKMKYYWRVTALNGNKSPISASSSVGEFSIDPKRASKNWKRTSRLNLE